VFHPQQRVDVVGWSTGMNAAFLKSGNLFSCPLCFSWLNHFPNVCSISFRPAPPHLPRLRQKIRVSRQGQRRHAPSLCGLCDHPRRRAENSGAAQRPRAPVGKPVAPATGETRTTKGILNEVDSVGLHNGDGSASCLNSPRKLSGLRIGTIRAPRSSRTPPNELVFRRARVKFRHAFI
jgi:hypothetical protein